MSVTNALWVNGISVRDARANMAALIAKNSTNPLDVRTGIFYTGVGTSILTGTTTTSPSMTVQVDRFHYVGRKSTDGGPYIGCHDTVETVNIAAAPASGSRIDVVYIMQRDADAPTSPDGSTIGELGVVTGLSGTTPSKPAIPTGALEIGTVTVGAGATKTTDATVTIAVTTPYTAAQGAPIPVRNTTERATLTGYEGLQVIRLDLDGMLQTYTGGVWTGSITKAGTFNSPSIAASTGGVSATVTFPSPFPAAPQGVTVVPGSSRLTMTVTNVTASGFTALFDNWSPGASSAVTNGARYIATYHAS